jgi:ribose transport system ATP-binding protein
VVRLEAREIEKSYDGVRALRGVSFDVRAGEVHALVGENGAGKSTMIKVLCGVTRPDTGRLAMFGQDVTLAHPADALRLGIATAFQELTLLPYLTVAENLLLRTPPRGRSGLVQRRRLVGQAAALLDRFEVTGVDPAALVTDLSVARRQVVEIVRALSGNPRVLFLDEPTAALSDREVDWLFERVRAVRDAGCCVIFTSHRWREIERLADQVTVFRNGTDVATRDTLSEAEAVTLMTGRNLDQAYPTIGPPGTAPPNVVTDLADPPGGPLRGISWTLRRGELLGVGGLAGQGQRELFLTLFGARHAAAGKVAVAGRPVRLRRPRDAIRAGIGIALVPEDRKAEGLVLPMSVRDNLTLAVLDRVSVAGLLRRGGERSAVDRMVRQLNIDTTRPASQRVGTLSGGNQQKVLMGRWLLTEADVLLLYDVTRGVDAATKHDFYRLVTDLAGRGKAVLMYSSETEEMAQLCHRVLVLREGRIAAELPGPVGDAELIVAASVREPADA